MNSHDHSHAPTDGNIPRRRLAIAFSITASILIAEVIGAAITGSLALLVDAAHMLTDASGLAMALFAANLIRRPATSQRTWGYGRAEIISAAAQAGVLLAVGVFVLVEAVMRLFSPPEIVSSQLLFFGILGLIGNLASILVLATSRNTNFNLRAAYLEVVNDALGSVAVIIAAIVIITTRWTGADSVAAIVIGFLILPRAFKLLRETLNVLLESTPKNLDLDAVRQHILELNHVRSVHDLHASQIATGLPVLTAHVVIDDECFKDGHSLEILDQLQECVATHFKVSVEHSTFQLESPTHSMRERPTHN